MNSTTLQLVLENAAVTATKVTKPPAVTAPGVTAWLDRLKKRGLLERKSDGTDRCTHNPRVTPVTPNSEELVTSALAKQLRADQQMRQANDLFLVAAGRILPISAG